MTEINPPFALQGGTINHPALLFRRLLSIVSAEGIGRFNGVNDLKVVENSPAAMSVLVSRGSGYVQGDDVTDQGLYFVYNDANKVVTIASSDLSLPRKDIVVARVKDNFHGQAGDTWTIEAIIGTPAGSPTEPALPATAMKLAVIDVPAADTSITNSQITDSRAYAGAPIGWMDGGSLIGTEPQANFEASFDVTDDPGNKRVNVAFNPTVEKEILYFRNVGLVYYAAGHIGGVLSNTAFSTGVLHALPFLSGRGGTLDRLAFFVSTGGGGGSVARAGIYNNTSDTNLYPSSLVVDGGEFVTTTTGLKAATISQALAPNSLYWFVYICGTAAPTIASLPTAAQIPILGLPASSFAIDSGEWTVSQTYGALPGTFPGGATSATGAAPTISGRYSA